MISIEVKNSDRSILCDLINQDGIEIYEPQNLDGESIIQFLVEITQITAPLVAGVILANINSNKITIKKKGVDITMNLSKRELKKMDIIKKLLDLEDKDRVNK